MRYWRFLILGGLIAGPMIFLMGLGGYTMWQNGWGTWVWLPMTASMALAYLLGWYWQHKQQLLRVDFNPPFHWTDRDKQAWRLVEARAQAGGKLTPENLGDLNLYVNTAKEMAMELARFYHPRTKNPVGSLTIPELLAVVELAAHDLTEMVDQYLPAGNLVTINHWLNAKKASDWYQTASQAYWVISALFSPLSTGMRYLASEVGVGRPLQKLQENLIIWFYAAYVQRLGTYLIDVNSGRLRVGAARYRELLQQQQARQRGDHQVPTVDGTPAVVVGGTADAAEAIPQITITLMGQVKAGKSSLINALLGEQRARTDVLPATAEITRYELKQEGIATRLILLDTVGYGHEGPKADKLRATEEAARQSDLILLVMHARNPARQADLDMLLALKRWFDSLPELKLPPILGVMTHMDLLSPSLEWAPPYHWQEPQRPKEQQIAQAVAAVREQLGNYLAGVVPVCTAADKVYGVTEWLLPAFTALLDDAHAVAFLRCLRAEANTGKARKVFQQLLSASQGAAKVLWEVMRSSGKP